MSFYLECKKMKRTGLVPAFFCGGLLAAAVPVLNMAFRSEMYLGLEAPPIQILMDANWQMMSMLNILLVTAGACLMYHTEYADNAIQRICTLPAKESRLFFGKSAFLFLMCAVILAVEAAGMAFCIFHWFGHSGGSGSALSAGLGNAPSGGLGNALSGGLGNALSGGLGNIASGGLGNIASAGIWSVLKSFGYAFLLMLPAVFGALWIASACRNLWVSLGIGVVCIFTATLLPVKSFVLSLFPFAMPFQILADTPPQTARRFMIAAAAELLVIAIGELIFLKLRRSFT